MDIKQPRLAELLGLQRHGSLHLLAGASFAFVLVRAVLLNTTELFPLGFEFGEIVYDLCVAFIAAWFFQLLVIVIPEHKRRTQILGATRKDLTRFAMCAAIIYEYICLKKGARPSDDPTLDEVKQRCAAVGRSSRAPLFAFGGAILNENLDWFDYFMDEVEGASRAWERLVPAFPYFDTELVVLMQPLVDTDFGREVRIIREKGIASPNLELIAESLHKYLTLSRKLELFLGPDVTGLQSSRRSDAEQAR